MGSATTAPTGPFHQERVRASHDAIGVPTSSRMTVTTAASLKVSQIADRSAEEKADSIVLFQIFQKSAYPLSLAGRGLGRGERFGLHAALPPSHPSPCKEEGTIAFLQRDPAHFTSPGNTNP